MKLVSVLSARVIWLFETVELNPRGLDINAVYGGIKAKYGFATPKNREEVENAKDGVKFLHGTYRHEDGRAIGVTLNVYSDGLVAETISSTADAELFLLDAASLAEKRYGLFFEPSMVQRRAYRSQIVIESEKGLARLTQSMETINQALSDATGKKFEATGIELGFDPTMGAEGLGPFSISRRGADVPFKANRFFSSAPLPTDAHLRLLEQFEVLMA